MTENIEASHSSAVLVAQDNNLNKDDAKDKKITKASSKPTEVNKTEKGEESKEADKLKSEKATKATRANMTEKVTVRGWVMSALVCVFKFTGHPTQSITPLIAKSNL